MRKSWRLSRRRALCFKGLLRDLYKGTFHVIKSWLYQSLFLLLMLTCTQCFTLTPRLATTL
jgi:hypothetical protein